MAKWIYIFLISTTIAAGVAVIIKMSTDPIPQVVMTPAYFNSPDELGTELLRRLSEPLNHQKVVVLGVPAQPGWYREIVRGFLAAAQAEKVPFDLVLSEELMPELDLTGLGQIEVHSISTNTKTQSELAERLQAARAAGKRVLIYTASVFATHLLPGNSVNRFEKQTGESLFSITVGQLALRSDQEFLIDPPCIGSERDQNGTSALGCAYLHASRQIYRKHLANDRYAAIMNSQRENDYLLLVAAPGQAVKAAKN